MDSLNLLTQEETAAMLHCSTHNVMRLRKRGILIGTRFGKRWVYREEDILAFIKSNIGKDLTNFRNMTPEAAQKMYGSQR